MRTTTKLCAYALVLVAVLGAGAAVGGAAGPVDVGGGDEGGHDGGGHGAPDVTGRSEERELPAGGLLVSDQGYSLVPEDRLADAGRFAFTVTGPDGHPVHDYDELHERRLHLILASRDLRTFHHVHPELDEVGRWTVDLPELAPGSYRAVADFQPAGADQQTLGVDLVAPGEAGEPEPLTPSRHDVVDGDEVTLTGEVVAGEASELTVTVHRVGEILTTEPYLGAPGHLVALRDGDLAYLHVHPLDEEPAGPVRFAVEVPSTGTYALFFDYVLDGDVRTARFVVTA